MAFWPALMPLESYLFPSRCRTIALLLLVWMGVCATALAQTTASLPSTAIHDKHVLILVTAEVGGAVVDN